MSSKSEIVIPINELTFFKKTGSSLITVIIGLYVAFLAWDYRTDAVIFGALIIIGGLISFINSINKSNNSNFSEFALKIDADSLFINPKISDCSSEKISLSNIKEVNSKLSPSGEKSLSIELHKNIDDDKKWIFIDISYADIDWLVFKDLLNTIVKKDINNRVEILNSFKTSSNS